MGKFDELVAIITGATGLIGRSIAASFAAEGARAVLSGTRPRPNGLPAGAIYIPGDVRDESHARNLVSTALEKFGRLDVLVNAHGVDFHSELPTTSLGDAEQVVAVNLIGALLTMKYALPAIEQGKRGGSIVNVASRLGQVAIPGQSVYSASKGGLIMLSRGVAIDYARKGIRVNVVAPGLTSGAMADSWLQAQPDPAAFRISVEQSIPMGRLARPEEIAAATVFLASTDSSYITGAVLPVDGGYTAA
jgi:NAD(P)-dependent dehydrogenase (short-subunit alcohol dehydrogenase family)